MVSCLAFIMSASVVFATKHIQVAGLIGYTGPSVHAEACLVSIGMALEDVRENPNILPDYELNITWKDSEVSFA